MKNFIFVLAIALVFGCIQSNQNTSDLNTAQPFSPNPVNSPVSSLVSNCSDQNCAELDWKNRSMQLPISDYQSEIRSDGKLVLRSSKFEVILPRNSSDAEKFGRIYLYGLIRAYNNTQNLLGRPPFLQPDLIRQEFSENISSTGLCCGPLNEGLPIYWSVSSMGGFDSMVALDSPSTLYLKSANWDRVFNGDHELTHRFVYNLSLSPFLDEGLAMYAQDHGDLQPIACGLGGYTQGTEFTRYSYLCYQNMLQIYNSGDCFWQRVEQNYGSDTLRRIISRIYNKSERDSLLVYYPTPTSPTARWTSFSGQLLIDLNQAFVPEIGDRFWNDFSDFGFSPNMADGLTYESELSRANCQ